jgi:hypothetical protein
MSVLNSDFINRLSSIVSGTTNIEHRTTNNEQRITNINVIKIEIHLIREQPLILILFCLIKKYSKNQDSLLFFKNSTFYFTIESRPQALWILTVS